MSDISEESVSANKFIEKELNAKLAEIGTILDCDMIALIAPMAQGVDDLVREAVEEITSKKNRVACILETDGGSIEVVERIGNLLRYHYPEEVSFLVPNFSMSAGTVLVMSGDKIYMDYYSILGPIDPQVLSRSRGDRYVPALGYLAKYDELIEKAENGKLGHAELAFFIEKFDPAELHSFEQARDLSIELLKNWLVKYKFKNWSVTRTNNTAVTDEIKRARADEIATKLNDVTRWKSHGRGLSKQVIENELNLLIDDLDVNPALNTAVKSYYRLLKDYMGRVRHELLVHVNNRYLGF